MTVSAAPGSCRAPRLPVPYVTAYEGEAVPYTLTAISDPGATRGARLAFPDHLPADWMWGTLWHRQGVSQTGAPLFGRVNTCRQRRCMRLGLCQVCGGNARDPRTGRLWWVLACPPWYTAAGEPYLNSPPTCPACIPMARRLCPKLGAESPVYTAARVEPYGVLGDLHRLAGGHGVPLVQEKVVVSFEEFQRLEFTLATQLLGVLEELRPAVLPGCAERAA
ncbi:unnamed protein product [[Actinomadura] parvosata subsp. kistnae]|uniref:Uncharacterized protein n=1 Tax=[Actinomadura] parvosata subsp. kistnae TaxID=1909395 RepID=A0A1U9ZXW6_9ACTN|nr:hypothetical protein [Nonomuraea sp. ATCC 55076]AQZ62784.1 hypothetical protein BKM31_16125 [Nonomuraea sp. ATCC 55076]SPL98302.1 unnamed protein product [Actinomadura parvosata subsp. kistnae]